MDLKILKMIKRINLSTFQIISSIISGSLFSIISLGGFYKLNPNNISWIEGDNLTSYIAQLFYLDDRWRFPLGLNPHYGLEQSTNLTYTGPSPILLIIQKIFLNSTEMQFFGIWVLINLTLHIYFSLKIANSVGFGRIQSFLLSLLLISPFLILRTQMHFWLISHFLILWSFYNCIVFFKKNKLSLISITSVVFISYAINAYLLAMVIVIHLSLVCVIFFNVKYKTHEAFKILGLCIISFLLALTTIDGFKKQKSLYESVKILVSSTYGHHHFNLLSFINPSTGFALEYFKEYGRMPPKEYPFLINFSSLNYSLGNTWGDYEGFTYLGAGTVIFVLAILILNYRGIFKLASTKTWRVILLTGFLITLFSVTNRIGLGAHEMTIPIPILMKWGLSIFRSSGRFMWVIAYGLIIFAAWRFSSILNSKRITIFLIICVSLQTVDLYKPLNQIYNFESQKIQKNTLDENAPQKLVELKSNKKILRVWPQGDPITNNYAQLNYWAWELGMKTDIPYTSRVNMFELKRNESKTFNQLCNNRISSNTIVVVAFSNLSKLDACRIEASRFVYENHIYFWNGLDSK